MEVAERFDARRWWALWACLTTVFLTLLDGTIVVVALPSIGTTLGAHATQLQWVLSGYALSFGLVPIIAGRLGDDRGRKQVMLVGVGGFVLTSALGGLAPNPEVLITARLLQGLFSGLLNPQVTGLIQNLFPPRERPRAFALFGVLIGVSSAAGPVLGGLVILLCGPHLGWRVTFLINVPIGTASFVLCQRWIPNVARNPVPRRLDLPGAGLLGLGLFGVLFPAIQYDSNRDVRLAWLFIPAAIVLAIFLWWEAGPGRRRGYPLIDISMFRIRSFADSCSLGLIYFAAVAAIPLVLTLFLQDGLGYSAFEAGAVASASAVGVVVSSHIGGRVLPRYGAKVLVAALWIFIGGAALMAVALWWGVTRGTPTTIGLALVIPLAIVGFGMGGVTTPNQALAYVDVDAAEASTAGGMLMTAQRVSVAIGSAFSSAIFYAIALSGHPVFGRTLWRRYGHAYLATLAFIVALGFVSLLIAMRTARRIRPAAINSE